MNCFMALMLVTNTILTLIIVRNILKRLDIFVDKQNALDELPSVEYVDLPTENSEMYGQMLKNLQAQYANYNAYSMPSDYIEHIIAEDDSVEVITNVDELELERRKRGY